MGYHMRHRSSDKEYFVSSVEEMKFIILNLGPGTYMTCRCMMFPWIKEHNIIMRRGAEEGERQGKEE